MENFDFISQELRADRLFNLGLDPGRAVGQVGKFDVLFYGIRLAVVASFAPTRQVHNCLAKRLAGNRSVMEAVAADLAVRVDDDGTLPELAGLNCRLLATRAAADNDEVVRVLTHSCVIGEPLPENE